MRVFVTGATGVVGRHLVPGLIAAGHEVTATTRTPGKATTLRAAGAVPLVLDGLDRDAVIEAVRAAAPEVIIHQMTALADMGSLRNLDKEFTVTNELRTKGTDNLLAAAQRAGTRRVITQGYTGWPNERSGGPVKTEDDPLGPPPPTATQTLAGIRHLEAVVPQAVPEGIVLRYGSFYGPGASMLMIDLVRKRQAPGHRRRHRDMVVLRDKGRRVRHGRRRRARCARHLQRGGQRAGAGVRVAALPGKRRRRQAAAARARLDWPAARRRVRRHQHDRAARLVEREGEEGTRLGAAVRELARGVP